MASIARQSYEEISTNLDRAEDQISGLLGGYMTPERFKGSILTLVRNNTDLLTKASPQSVMAGVMRIAQLRLSPDPSLGQAWLVPRKGHAQMQIGYKGYLALAYRSPMVQSIRYGVVREGDHFVWEDGRAWTLEHRQGPLGWPETPEETVAAWAIIELMNGGEIPRVMYRAEILRHKARGQGSQPAWSTDFAAMCAKTVIADVCRRGPLEAEMAQALAFDEGYAKDLEDAFPESSAGKKAVERVEARINKKKPEPDLPEEEDEEEILDAEEVEDQEPVPPSFTTEQRRFMNVIRRQCEGIGDKNAEALVEAGISSAKEIMDRTDKELLAVRGVGQKSVASLREWAKGETTEAEDEAEPVEAEPAEKVTHKDSAWEVRWNKDAYLPFGRNDTLSAPNLRSLETLAKRTKSNGLNVVRQWVEDVFDVPLEEVPVFFYRVIYEFTEGQGDDPGQGDSMKDALHNKWLLPT